MYTVLFEGRSISSQLVLYRMKTLHKNWSCQGFKRTIMTSSVLSKKYRIHWILPQWVMTISTVLQQGRLHQMMLGMIFCRWWKRAHCGMRNFSVNVKKAQNVFVHQTSKSQELCSWCLENENWCQRPEDKRDQVYSRSVWATAIPCCYTECGSGDITVIPSDICSPVSLSLEWCYAQNRQVCSNG